MFHFRVISGDHTTDIQNRFLIVLTLGFVVLLYTIHLNVRKDVTNAIMYIEDCIWLPDILVKLFVKHHVTQKEVEEIFFNRPKYRFVESGYRKGEDVYSAAGQTDAGRYLIVFFIQKPNNLLHSF